MGRNFLAEEERMELHIKHLIEDMEERESQICESMPEDLDSYYDMLKDSEPIEEPSHEDFEDLIEFLEDENEDEDYEDEALFFYQIYGSYIPPDHHHL